jgi:hypothetical protein
MIVYFSQVFLTTEEDHVLGATFSTVKAYILTKNGVGYILGHFFTLSSGHPASNVPFY